jgi:hypothetical protein
MYSVPAREETTGILKELLEPGSKKQEEEKRWFSLLNSGT